MTAPRSGPNWYGTTASLGVAVGAVAMLSAVWVDPGEPPAPEPTAHGVVRTKLGAPCAPFDRKLAERLYGAGAIERSDAVTAGETTDCEWVSSPHHVTVEAELSDYPEGGEVQAAHDSYLADLADAEEGDPARGLPQRVRGLGHEAYAVHDPKRGARDEETVRLQVRSGNVVLAVSVRRAARAPAVGERRLVSEARRLAAAAVRRLP